MNPDLAIDLFKSTVMFALYIVAPFLGVTLVVGLVTSLLQSVTSMQEQTLTFVPKLLALAGRFEDEDLGHAPIIEQFLLRGMLRHHKPQPTALPL